MTEKRKRLYNIMRCPECLSRGVILTYDRFEKILYGKCNDCSYIWESPKGTRIIVTVPVTKEKKK